MPLKIWTITSSMRDRSFGIFNLRTDRARSPRTGEEHSFIILESRPWVNVIPLTHENEVVMIRQYRHGIRDITLEIPGGIVEPDDTPEKAALRELQEETGYQSNELINLNNVHPNPAIQDNLCYSFLALNVVLASSQDLGAKEDIEVVLYPIEEIPRLIRESAITHSLVIAAFYRFFMEHRPHASV